MPDMTLQEALQTPEVKAFLGALIQESVAEVLPDAVAEALPAAVKAAVDEQVPTLRESLAEDLRKETLLPDLHSEAVRLIESSKLRGAAKDNLLQDYGLAESAGEVKPGRALALIEAVVDGDGNVVKSEREVLRESVEADIKRQRNILREAAPTIPRAPGGGGDSSTPAAPDPADSEFARRMRDKGMDPAQFGHPAGETTT